MNNETTQRAKEIIELQAERTSLKTMADYVKEYIIAYCDEDHGFVECVNNPEKSFMDCIGYIKKKALDWLKQQQNLELSNYAQGVGGDVPNDTCYQWAIEYYYSKPEPKPEPKKVDTSSSSKSKTGKKNATKGNPKNESENEQMSLMGNVGKQVETISLFDNIENVKSPDKIDKDEQNVGFDDTNDAEFSEYYEDESDFILETSEELTDEEIANLPFDREAA